MLTQLITSPLFTFAAACDPKSTTNWFFGLKPWYYYLQLAQDGTTGQCEIANFQMLGQNSSFLLIGLVVLDDLLRIAAMVAVGFVIWGGITYVTSQGSPDQTGQAQKTIVNALIGLVIAMLSAGIVGFLGSRLG